MKVRKFAWLPTFVKLSYERRAIVWLGYYWIQKSDNLPILCDCESYPCCHTKTSGYFKYPDGKLGIVSFEI